MKLCTLENPNMKICTLVGYPSPLRFTPCYPFLEFEILRQFTMRFVITTPPSVHKDVTEGQTDGRTDGRRVALLYTFATSLARG
jgi:hypothetical protein